MHTPLPDAGDTFTYCSVGAMRVAYASRGADDRTAPLALFLHGFPDTHLGLLPAMDAAAAAGFRCVAPEPRGYLPSDLAPDGDYRVAAFARDVLDLADALGAARFYIVGHDWGALTAYAAANLAPERVIRMVTAGVPHTGHFLLNIRLRQLVRSSYMLRFQLPFLPEWEIARHDFAWLEKLIGRWSPAWRFTPQDLRLLKQGFADPRRLKAALAYYRQLPRSLADPLSRRLIFAPVSVPTRVICGGADGCIGPELFAGQQRCFTGEFELVQMAGAGHFMQWERPGEFARMALDFLRRGG
jgi:pimeloyl-ACP methyl ester carboxylesterase